LLLLSIVALEPKAAFLDLPKPLDLVQLLRNAVKDRRKALINLPSPLVQPLRLGARLRSNLDLRVPVLDLLRLRVSREDPALLELDVEALSDGAPVVLAGFGDDVEGRGGGGGVFEVGKEGEVGGDEVLDLRETEVSVGEQKRAKR
jgi:hypothetical protein